MSEGKMADAGQPRTQAERITFVGLCIAFTVAQLMDYATHLGLSYFAESNPLLTLFRDVVDHKVYEFVLKVALVGFVIWVARLQRRRAIGLALLLLGTIAGVLGALSNVNAWTYL